MRILDRYILRLFLSSYCICLFTLLSIYVAIDFFEKSDDFQDYLEAAQQVMGEKGKNSQNPLTVYLNYYLCYLPMIFIRIAPAITLMASVFTFTKLMKANELIPIKSSGISIYRIMLPVFFCGFLLSIALILIQEYLLPALSARINEAQALEGKGWKFYPHIQRFDQKGNVIFMQKYFPHTQEMENVEITCFDSTYQEQNTICAEKGELVLVEEQWYFYLQNVHFFKYDKEARLVAGYPRFEESYQIATSLAPYQVVGNQSHTSIETLSVLFEKHRNNPGISSILVSIHSRFTLPLANLIFLTLGLPLVIFRESKTFFLSIGICILVSAIYFTVNLIFIHFGNKGLLHPIAAAWFPVIFFGALGMVVMNMMET